MITLRLSKLLAKLSYESNQPQLTIEELAKATGYNRQSLTKILKAPAANVTTGIIDAILQVFFERFKKVDKFKELSDQKLMKMLVDEFVDVQPDKKTLVTKQKPKRKVKKK